MATKTLDELKADHRKQAARIRKLEREAAVKRDVDFSTKVRGLLMPDGKADDAGLDAAIIAVLSEDQVQHHVRSRVASRLNGE